MFLHFVNGLIYNDGSFIEGDLWVAHGKITNKPQKNAQVIDVKGNYIVPGFIDLQINGAFGYDFTKNPESISKASRLLTRYGVTSFLATVISSKPETYFKVLPIIQRQIRNTPGAQLLGIHLEGPCFNKLQTKAHCSSHIYDCQHFGSPKDCYGSLEGVKIVTLAPEIPGALEWIDWLTERDIVISAGHSIATMEEFDLAVKRGVSCATHLFNAMAQMQQRSPGIIGKVLATKGLYYSIIADGVHVDPCVLNVAWNAQPEGLILISDAVSATGKDSGEFLLGEREVYASKGIVRTKDTGDLAGCGFGLSELVEKFCTYTGATLGEAVRAVTEKPAKLLDIYPQKGSLDIGSDADIIILKKGNNTRIEVMGTYMG